MGNGTGLNYYVNVVADKKTAKIMERSEGISDFCSALFNYLSGGSIFQSAGGLFTDRIIFTICFFT
jgi:hypothetical protein